MDVNNVRGLAGASGQVVESSTARPQGRIVDEVQAVSNSPVNALARAQAAASSTLVGGDKGLILYRDNKSYIRGGEGPIAVYTPDAWRTVLMSDSSRLGHVPLRWHCGHWRIDDAGMGKVTSPLDWLKYKLIGKQPPEHSEQDPELVNMALNPFDIPPGHDREFLEKWLVHDWFNPLPDQKGGWPAWAVKYAKNDEVVALYLHQKLFNSGACFCEAATRAYEREIAGLEGKIDWRSALFHRVTKDFNTAEVCNYFSGMKNLLPKVEQLVDASDFDNCWRVYDYMNKFWFPQTTDGDVLKAALLTDRLHGRRTPAWAGHYVTLQSLKDYFQRSESLECEKRKGLLTEKFAAECYGSDSAQAQKYLAEFATDKEGQPDWQLLEELVLDQILDEGKWAARSAGGPPRAVLL